MRDSALFDALDSEDAAAVEAFAAAHPDSPISDRVQTVITRHNTSPYTKDEAVEIVSGLVPGAADAVCWRRANRDYAVAVSVDGGAVILTRCKLENGSWSLDESRRTERYTLDGTLSDLTLKTPLELVEVGANKNRDKLLNTIYFEDENTLDMFYYKGKTTFKYKVNLATKSLKR